VVTSVIGLSSSIELTPEFSTKSIRIRASLPAQPRYYGHHH
jgi:hypothetical protein